MKVPFFTGALDFSLGPSQQTTVTINAPSAIIPNSDFTVTVEISRVNNFNAANYTITFNESVVRLDNITAGLIGSTTIPARDYLRRIERSLYLTSKHQPA